MYIIGEWTADEWVSGENKKGGEEKQGNIYFMNLAREEVMTKLIIIGDLLGDGDVIRMDHEEAIHHTSQNIYCLKVPV